MNIVIVIVIAIVIVIVIVIISNSNTSNHSNSNTHSLRLDRVRAVFFSNQAALRPVHLLRVFLLRVLESNFPGDSL